jgi:hypothetical protein
VRCNTPAPDGVRTIETRTLIAYALILLMVAAAAGGIFYLRYNSYERKNARRRDREQARWDEQNADEGTK